MQHGDAAQRSVADLSRFLSGPDGTLALARMQVLQLPPVRSTDVEVPAPSADGRIGVWHPADGALVRDPRLRDEWRYWADLDEVPLPDRARPTVALLGESAARGYFFDPVHSLAGLVRTALGEDAQVLDLARTNCSLQQLLQTAADAADLGVDALVVYAGNNWNNVSPTPVEAQELADLITDAGFPAAMSAFRGLVTGVGAAALDTIRTVAGDVPVVVVIPEFNLADWVDEPALDTPALPHDRLPRWRELRRQAETAIAGHDAHTAAGLAQQMIELDGGASPVSQRLRAQSADDAVTRIAALEAARDAPVSPFTLHSPRTLTAVQQMMRVRGSELGFHVVDQTALFRPDGTAPGSEFFLDYCHLSFEGLRITAAAVADALAGALGLTATPGAVPPAEPGSVALAHFLAAVHNAHYGQPEAALRHHVRTALGTDASVAGHLKDYLDYQTRCAPNWMCASYERSAQVPAFRRYLVVGDGRLNGALADHVLRDVMLTELLRAGHDIRDDYAKLLVAEYAGPADLLADAHLAGTFGARAAAGTGPRTAYLRAGDERTSSTFVLTVADEVSVAVTWRLPGTGPAAVELTVNGRDVLSTTLGSSWRTDEIAVPAGLLRAGLNTIEIRWPTGGDGSDALVSSAAARLTCGETPASHPVHGHVAEWTVTPMRAVPA